MADDKTSQDAVRIERSFDAPVDLIWQMWTDPEHFAAWYGPNGATIPVAKMDVRVGGTRLVCMEMQTPNGSMQMWFTGEYREVVENERLVYTESMSDENGNVMTPSDMNMPEEHPTTTEVRVELLEQVRNSRHSPQLGAKDLVEQCSLSRAEILGELDAPIGFDATVHLGFGEADERLGNGFRCEFDADVAEELRLDPGHDDFAVDEHAVTIEDVQRRRHRCHVLRQRPLTPCVFPLELAYRVGCATRLRARRGGRLTRQSVPAHAGILGNRYERGSGGGA